jgi:hypothetical protein
LQIYVPFHLMLKYVLLGLYYKQRLLFMKLRVLDGGFVLPHDTG